MVVKRHIGLRMTALIFDETHKWCFPWILSFHQFLHFSGNFLVWSLFIYWVPNYYRLTYRRRSDFVISFLRHNHLGFRSVCFLRSSYHLDRKPSFVLSISSESKTVSSTVSVFPSPSLWDLRRKTERLRRWPRKMDILSHYGWLFFRTIYARHPRPVECYLSFPTHQVLT